MRRRLEFLACVGAALFGLFAAAIPCAGVQADEPTVEYKVKAAYLSKFGNFVQWPATGSAAQQKDATICVLGRDPFGTALDDAVRGKQISGRSIAVRRIDDGGPVDGCQILYISEPKPERVRSILNAVRGRDVLTVSDTHADDSSIITFVIQQNNVRFEIDESAAVQNGLVISSQLLALATTVKAAK